MELSINGRTEPVDPAWHGESLLSVLREHLGLVGTRLGCGAGRCGACTVLVDGRPSRSCVLPAASAVGAAVETIEGLAGPSGELHPVQRAWLDEAVPQCGYCQSGQIVSAVALLRRVGTPSAAEVEAAMDGNLCRCGTQRRIRAAVARAAAASGASGAADAGGARP